jgi:hypothetical protein
MVVDVIERSFPELTCGRRYTKIVIDSQSLVGLESIAALTDEVPNHLIILQSEEYADFALGAASLKSAVLYHRSLGFKPSRNLEFVRGKGETTALDLVYVALKRCPDSAPHESTSGFDFISDDDHRFDLRTDLSSANSALDNGEWKAATVLSGSIVEALLLWKLLQSPPQEIDGFINSQSSKKLRNDLNKWMLDELIGCAKFLNSITDECERQCRLVQDFRNLIHPGKATRKSMKCDRATALSALAGVEHLIREFSSQIDPTSINVL